MLRKLFIGSLLLLVLLGASLASALSRSGFVPDTPLIFDELSVDRAGVSVLLVNSSDIGVRISSKLVFLDDEFNGVGETFFAIREIEPWGSVRFNSNYLKGNWKKVAKTSRLRWELFTYEEQR